REGPRGICLPFFFPRGLARLARVAAEPITLPLVILGSFGSCPRGVPESGSRIGIEKELMEGLILISHVNQISVGTGAPGPVCAPIPCVMRATPYILS